MGATNKRLQAISELDTMTGVFNKTATEQRVKKILKEKPDSLHACMIIDLDNFKSINDTSGHLEGDRTIITIA